MIYELEMHFGDQQFDNPQYFPHILIVRKKKTQQNLEKAQNHKNWPEVLKNILKQNQEYIVDKLQGKIREQKQYLTNSLKTIENDLSNITKELDKTYHDLQMMMFKVYNRANKVNNSLIISNQNQIIQSQPDEQSSSDSSQSQTSQNSLVDIKSLKKEDIQNKKIVPQMQIGGETLQRDEFQQQRNYNNQQRINSQLLQDQYYQQQQESLTSKPFLQQNSNQLNSIEQLNLQNQNQQHNFQNNLTQDQLNYDQQSNEQILVDIKQQQRANSALDCVPKNFQDSFDQILDSQNHDYKNEITIQQKRSKSQQIRQQLNENMNLNQNTIVGNLNDLRKLQTQIPSQNNINNIDGFQINDIKQVLHKNFEQNETRFNDIQFQLQEVIQLQRHNEIMSQRNQMLLQQSLQMQDSIIQTCQNNKFMIDQNNKLQSQVTQSNDQRCMNQKQEFERMQIFLKQIHAQICQLQSQNSSLKVKPQFQHVGSPTANQNQKIIGDQEITRNINSHQKQFQRQKITTQSLASINTKQDQQMMQKAQQSNDINQNDQSIIQNNENLDNGEQIGSKSVMNSKYPLNINANHASRNHFAQRNSAMKKDRHVYRSIQDIARTHLQPMNYRLQENQSDQDYQIFQEQKQHVNRNNEQLAQMNNFIEQQKQSINQLSQNQLNLQQANLELQRRLIEVQTIKPKNIYSNHNKNSLSLPDQVNQFDIEEKWSQRNALMKNDSIELSQRLKYTNLMHFDFDARIESQQRPIPSNRFDIQANMAQPNLTQMPPNFTNNQNINQNYKFFNPYLNASNEEIPKSFTGVKESIDRQAIPGQQKKIKLLTKKV